MNILKYIK